MMAKLTKGKQDVYITHTLTSSHRNTEKQEKYQRGVGPSEPNILQTYNIRKYNLKKKVSKQKEINK